MAVAWTTITNAQVAAGAPLTTALVTSLRDNPEGIAQRASGAPKIFGVPYDYQEFTTNGTWSKPSNIEAGDVIYVQVVGGGGGGHNTGTSGAGGGGGGGLLVRFEDPTLFGATESVTVGAGGAATVAGGDSIFGTSPSNVYLKATGGTAGAATTAGGTGFAYNSAESGNSTHPILTSTGGSNDTGVASVAGASFWGGGAGGNFLNTGSVETDGGNSREAGRGGNGSLAGTGTAGVFPGGGGGAGSTGGGAGANGVVRVWCVKEE